MPTIPYSEQKQCSMREARIIQKQKQLKTLINSSTFHAATAATQQTTTNSNSNMSCDKQIAPQAHGKMRADPCAISKSQPFILIMSFTI